MYPVHKPQRNSGISVDTRVHRHAGLKSRSIRNAQSRAGTALVELALVLPLMVLIVFGTIEICQRIFLRQGAVIAAYEGARLATHGISSGDDIKTSCNNLLAGRGIKQPTVTISPAEPINAVSGTPITVKVEIPWANNSPTGFILSNQGKVTINAVMLRQ